MVAFARARFQALALGAQAGRSWPHHFDLAARTSFPGADAETANIGAGFSP
ncbi:MAG: hypothetical protein KGQ37_12230 [Hyphomicrobiales bacterium]|nr:hypothetical protein [Hyphomicrobiales bacterium]